jgi:hypothetical protein
VRWCVGSSASGSWHVAAERDHASPGVRKECDAGEGRPRGATRAERSIFTLFSPHGPHCGQHWQPIRYKVYSQRRSVAHSQRRSVAASIMAVHVIGRPSPARLRHVSSTHTPGALWEAGANSTTNTRRTLRKPAWMRCAIRATALVPRAIRQQRAPIGHFSDSIL